MYNAYKLTHEGLIRANLDPLSYRMMELMREQDRNLIFKDIETSDLALCQSLPSVDDDEANEALCNQYGITEAEKVFAKNFKKVLAVAFILCILGFVAELTI